MFRLHTIFTVILLLCVSTALFSCAPVEYSVVIVGAADSIEKAEAAGAACTEQQLAALSPVTRYNALQSGTELASTETSDSALSVASGCRAPYEYYMAVEYLSKAREEVGYSDYQAALEYAREARKYAQRARELTMSTGRESGR